MPLKCKIMAEKQDIAMNEFPINNVADYLYTEKGNNQQKVTPTDLVKSCGFFRLDKTITPGETYELPYNSGLIMVQNASSVHQKAIAVVYGSNTGNIIVPQGAINFFSEVENKFCIMSAGENTKYVVKSTYASNQHIILTFIS
jgi:hypothetical protein|nr:MAG TPA: hypothetical protein [Caudoviricetes sp.]